MAHRVTVRKWFLGVVGIAVGLSACARGERHAESSEPLHADMSPAPTAAPAAARADDIERNADRMMDFLDSRLKDAKQFPVAARAGFAEVRSDDDQITMKLAALQFYQLAIPAPIPPKGSFDAAAAKRGQAVFEGRAKCATCHVPPLFTEPGWNLHTPAEIGIDSFQSDRSPDKRYRTTPLRGLFSRQEGGFYHDGRFATLAEVVDHYDQTFHLGLSAGQKTDLTSYLLSL